MKLDRWSLTATATGTPILIDRPYALKAIPKELRNASMLVRDSGAIGRWLPADEVIAKQSVTGYVAIQTQNTSQQKVSEETISKFIAAGWSKVDGFETTAPDKEEWEWVLLSREFSKGPLNVPQVASLRTNYIFLFD